MKKIRIIATLVIVVALTCSAAFAASSTPTKKPSLISRMMGHHGKGAKTTATTAGSGQIIGDKKTKVYHLPGDKSMLPAVQNRVYFKTEAAAQAAGYRHAGSRSSGKSKSTKKSSPKKMSAKKMGAKTMGGKKMSAKPAGKKHAKTSKKGATTTAPH